MSIEVNQKVKVRRLRDKLPADVLAQLKQNPVGTVTGYKMVDGSGVGYVVKFSNNLATWFFADELESV